MGEIKITIPESLGAHDIKRKSYQARALFRKTLSHQKRQWKVNFCCAFICPLMTVAIAAIQMIAMNSAIGSSTAPKIVQTIRFCSNVPNMNPNGGGNIPLFLRDRKRLYNQTFTNQIFHANYFQLDSINKPWPCIQVFQNSYKFSLPYQPDPGVPLTRDSTFLPDPTGGWWSPDLDTIRNVSSPEFRNLYTGLNAVQQFPWNYVYVPREIQAGRKDQSRAFQDPSDLPAPGSETNKSGLLGRTPTHYFRLSDSNSTDHMFIPADFYVPVDVGADDLDEFIASKLVSISKMYENSFSPYYNASGSWKYPPEANATFWLSRENMKIRMSNQIVIAINSYDSVKNILNVTLQTGSSSRLGNAIYYSMQINPNVDAVLPPKGFRVMQQISELSNALLQSAPVEAARNSFIAQSIRAFANDKLFQSHSFEFNSGTMTFPVGLSFLLPVFVLSLVREKENKILVMMKMHGLSTFAYYVTQYLHFFAIQSVCSLVFVLSGLAFQLPFFTQTDPGVYIVTLLIWANTLIALAFILSLFFRKTRTAIVLTSMILVISFNIGSLEPVIFGVGQPPDLWYIWPPSAFYHLIGAIGDAAIAKDRAPYRTKDLFVSGNDVATAFTFLVVESLFLLLAMFYLQAVVPTEYGVSKPWHFIFSYPFIYLRKVFRCGYRQQYQPVQQNSDNAAAEDDIELLEDSDAKLERRFVTEIEMDDETFHRYPLIVSNIRKVFGNGKVANKSMCLHVERNIVFGLLGPNGAGKSTLIQMITGLYPPSSGSAYVTGYNINTEMDSVYLNIGVCPQHDILWSDLTCEEHLLFYARLRGISKELENEAVEKSLVSVNLEMHRNRLSQQLSGGEKRRLSIAIALIGDVSLVFMDEPTTGLDPEVRRTIWNVIQKEKQKRTIILTTHSMEEADFLSTRIGIMSKGVLRCIGTPLHLKRKYGRGFKLTISFYKEADREAINAKRPQKLLEPAEACSVLESLLPQGSWRKFDQAGLQGCSMYEFEDAADHLGALIDEIEARKFDWGIEDWGISQTSLEEVFLNIIKDEDAEATS